MSLKGEFSWIQSLRQGGRKAISFTLTCTNMFQSETFDAAIVAGNGQIQPMIFRQQTLKAKQSLRFDFDTVDWNWCQGDIFAILDKKGQMAKKWVLNLKIYAAGECPQCHGTHKCRQCNGTGTIYNQHTHTYSNCMACNGSGVCQTCYVPIRDASQISGGNTIYNPIGGVSLNDGISQNAEATRQRKITALRTSIRDLQSKLESAKFDERMMKLRGTDLISRPVYFSQIELVSRYERELINLQYELSQLEQMG